MSEIEQLSSKIAAILRIQANIPTHQNLRWDSAEVRDFARLTRDSFNGLGEEVRGQLQNPFFVFDLGLANHGVTLLSGPAVFIHTKGEPTDEVQTRFEAGCLKLAEACKLVVEKLSQRRHLLLTCTAESAEAAEKLVASLENLLAELGDSLVGSASSTSIFMNWDKRLRDLVGPSLQTDAVTRLKGVGPRRALVSNLISTALTSSMRSSELPLSTKQAAAPHASNYIVVLTVSTIEFKAVCDHLDQPKKIKITGPGGVELSYSAKIGIFEGHAIIVICSFGGGDHKISAAMVPALMRFSPSLLMFVGIGGGVSPSASIGTVVIADYISDVSKTREEAGGKTSHMIRGGKIHRSLIPLANQVSEEDSWLSRIRLPKEGGDEEYSRNILVGKIAGANVLVTSDEGPTSKILETAGSDTLAIDMESAACYGIATEYDIPFIPVRGISDVRTDKDKRTDMYRQPIAAAHASAAAFELIHLYIERRADEKTETALLLASSGITVELDSMEPKEDLPIEGEVTTTAVPETLEGVHSEHSKSIASDRIIQPIGALVEAKTMSTSSEAEHFWKDIATLTRFGKLPVLYRGSIITLHVRFDGASVSAAEVDCIALGIEYGASLTQKVSIVKPDFGATFSRLFKFDFLSRVYTTNDMAEWLMQADTSSIYAVTLRLEFGHSLVRSSTLYGKGQATQSPGFNHETNESSQIRQYVAGMILIAAKEVKASQDAPDHV